MQSRIDCQICSVKLLSPVNRSTLEIKPIPKIQMTCVSCCHCNLFVSTFKALAYFHYDLLSKQSINPFGEDTRAKKEVQ